MKILPPNFGSVHSPISLRLNCKVFVQISDESLLPPPPRFIWDPSKSETFSLLLGRYDNIIKLDSLKERLDVNNLNKYDIDNITKELTEILLDNAKSCLSIARRRKGKSGKTKKNPWYNNDCSSLKKRLTNLAKLLTKSPKNSTLRGQFYTLKKEYRKLVKKNKKTFEIDNINKLNGLTQYPKKFWEQLKRMKKGKSSTIGNYISRDEWIGHFKSLNNKDPSNSPQNANYC